MSYDVSIRVPVKGVDEFVTVADLGNITWNVRELILRSSGWDIQNEANNGPVLPWLEKIKHGFSELEYHMLKYKQYEAENGWGTVEGTRRFYRECIKNAESWIMWNGIHLLPVAVVWVE